MKSRSQSIRRHEGRRRQAAHGSGRCRRLSRGRSYPTTCLTETRRRPCGHSVALRAPWRDSFENLRPRTSMRLGHAAPTILVPEADRSGTNTTHSSFRQCPELPLSFVVDKDPRVITVKRSTVVQVGIVIVVLAALGAGIAIGLVVGSKSSVPTTKSTVGTSTTTTHHVSTTTTSPPTTTTTVAPVPTVLSCGPGSTPHVRPTALKVGCVTGYTTVTAITWKVWGAAHRWAGYGHLKRGPQ